MFQRAIAGDDIGFALAASAAAAEERRIDACRFHRFENALVRMHLDGLFRFLQHGAERLAGRRRQEALGMQVLFGPAQLPRLGQHAIDHAFGAADIEMGAKGLGLQHARRRE